MSWVLSGGESLSSCNLKYFLEAAPIVKLNCEVGIKSLLERTHYIIVKRAPNGQTSPKL